MVLTVLMVLDALVAIVLIAAVLGQEPKSAGMGGMDALLARVTMVFAALFAVITLAIAKLTM